MRCAVVLGLALSACGTDPVAPPVPAKLEVLRGPTAISVPGQRYDTISVRLTGTGGESIVGWPVTWSGDGQVVPLDSVTDDVGIARAEWTLPRTWELSLTTADGPEGAFALTATAVGFESVTRGTQARAFRVDSLTVAMGHACGLRGAELWCWANPHPLQNGLRLPHRVPLPALVPRLVRTSDVMLCVLDDAGLPACASADDPGVFRRVGTVPPLLDLVASDRSWTTGSQFCGRARADSTLWCWPQHVASQLAGEPLHDLSLAAVDLGYDFGCGLVEDGSAWCWGGNSAGQLGDSSHEASSIPVPVVGGLRFNTIGAGYQTACGTTESGEVWCWGEQALPSTASVPQLIEPAATPLPKVVVGDYRDVYVRRGSTVRMHLTRNDTGYAQAFFRELAIQELVGGHGELCATLESGAVYCGWRIITGSLPSTNLPTPLVPVPDPASRP